MDFFVPKTDKKTYNATGRPNRTSWGPNALGDRKLSAQKEIYAPTNTVELPYFVAEGTDIYYVIRMVRYIKGPSFY